jgi:RPA family protein
MSADEQSGAGRREVAYRVFAAEYDDADFQYTENEVDERAPNYVVTPTGARVNRLFVVGVLTEIERVNDSMLRGRIVDPTGAFVVYAGQYQPDALSSLERLDPPAFVAVTGKARTFQPEDAETIYTSVRPESINEVDADTRDRWTVGAARHTLDRVATFADALERGEHGEELTAALEADGADHGLAAGIPLAIDHYDTTPAYLEAVREMAIEAAEVIAGEREEVSPLDAAPGEGGTAGVDLDAGAGLAGPDAGDESRGAETVGEAETAGGEVKTTGDTGGGTSGESGTEPATEPASIESDLEAVTSTHADRSSASDDQEAEAGGVAAATDEMYEFDEGEREEIESEFGTDFNTGAEVDEPGASDLDASETAATGSTGEPGEQQATTGDPATVDEPEPSDEPEEVEQPASDVDLEVAVVDAMRDLDSGDGAQREAVIEAVSDEHGVDPAEVEDAIQDALMSGTCYEPGDGLLKAI